MVAAISSQTTVCYYNTTQHHNPDDLSLKEYVKPFGDYITLPCNYLEHKAIAKHNLLLPVKY
jgi:hypothetical protein